MTPKQRQLLDFIEAFTAEHRFPPSYEEMRVALGHIAKSNAFRLTIALEEQGCIIRTPNRARSIKVVGAVVRPRPATRDDLTTVETGAMLDELYKRASVLSSAPMCSHE